MKIEQLPLVGKLYVGILENILQNFHGVRIASGSRNGIIKYDKLKIHIIAGSPRHYLDTGEPCLVIECDQPNNIEIEIVWSSESIEDVIQIRRKGVVNGLYVNESLDNHTPAIRKHIHEVFIKLQQLLKEYEDRKITPAQIL